MYRISGERYKDEEAIVLQNDVLKVAVLPGWGAKLEDGRLFDLSSIPEKKSGDYQKYWFLGKVKQGWCSLHDPHRRLNIDMSWPGEEVPYLGVWVNEGAWAGQYNIAPEPATGAMDRVDFSKMWGMGSLLKSSEKK